MSDEKTKTYAIVNPQSAGGATMRRWPRTSEKLQSVIGEFDYDFTNAEGVATMLTSEAIKKGYEKIIAVGGDGTLHEVVQGLFENGQMLNPDIQVGTLPSGTGTDFARALKLTGEIEESIVHLRGEKCLQIDLGQVSFKDHKGGDGVSYLINMADVGLGGDVANRANNSPKVFGGFATYLFSSIISFAAYKPKKVRIVADETVIEKKVTSVFVANGQYFGGGMHISPHSEIDDEFFDLIIVGELSKWDVVPFTPKLYSGKLLTDPHVEHLQAKNIRIESDEAVLVNIDGEVPGTTPVEFKLLPKVLKFKI